MSERERERETKISSRYKIGGFLFHLLQDPYAYLDLSPIEACAPAGDRAMRARSGYLPALPKGAPCLALRLFLEPFPPAPGAMSSSSSSSSSSTSSDDESSMKPAAKAPAEVRPTCRLAFPHLFCFLFCHFLQIQMALCAPLIALS